MRPYAILDLHCDTLTDYGLCGGEKDTLDCPKYQLSLTKLPKDLRWGQFFAVFTPEKYRGEEAILYYEENRRNFLRQMEKFRDRVYFCRSAEDLDRAWAEGKCAAFFTVENASVLAGRLDRIALLREQGVRCMSLTWNAENELASGHDTEHGFSAFGRAAVPEMERQGILCDVSHLNDTGFYEFLELAEKPFLATHSDARSVCAHRRNLTDEMIREMVRRNCLIGLNYCTLFLKDGGINITPEDAYRHVACFLELGAEHNLALGSDFDGCDEPEFLSSPEKVADCADYLLARGLSEDTVEDIAWRNAAGFLRRNL